MATWWKVERIWEDVTPVNVIRETDKFVVIAVPNLVGGFYEVRAVKLGAFDQYFPTKIEALTHLVERSTGRLAQLRKSVTHEESKLAKATEQLQAESEKL